MLTDKHGEGSRICIVVFAITSHLSVPLSPDFGAM